MSDLPKGWADGMTVEDVAEIRSGNGFPKKYQGRTEGELPFFKVGDISRNWQRRQFTLTEADHYISREDSKQIRAKTLPEGSVVFAKIGAAVALNRRAILGTEALVDNNVMGLVPSDATTSRFLFYFMCQVDLGAATRGGAVPSLRKGDVGTLEFPLPPLPEQRRIVARIDELFSRLDAGVAALRQAKAQLQRYRQSVLAAAVTGQLTQQWREQHPDTEPAEELLERILEQRRERWDEEGKYKEPAAPDTRDLKDLPSTWAWTVFEGVLAELRNGISMKPNATNGLRILRISAVRPLAVNLDDSRFLADSHSDFGTYELAPNDLLFTRYNGTRSFVGVCGLVPTLPEPFVYPDKLIRARLANQEALLPSFVEIAMNSGVSRRFLEKRIRTTAGQSGISGGDVKVTPLPIPPLAEQHQIVAEVETRTAAIDHLEAELDREIARSDRLRQSTLAAAFTGRL